MSQLQQATPCDTKPDRPLLPALRRTRRRTEVKALVKTQSADGSMICPHCNLRRTAAEFIRDFFEFAYCATCRNRKPELKKVYIHKNER